jgi:hypothetical protein
MGRFVFAVGRYISRWSGSRAVTGQRRAQFSNGAGCDVFAEIVHRKRRWRDCAWTCVAASRKGVTCGYARCFVMFGGVQWRTVVKTWRVRREIACVPTHGEGGNSRRTVCARGLLGEVCVLCRLALTMMNTERVCCATPR